MIRKRALPVILALSFILLAAGIYFFYGSPKVKNVGLGINQLKNSDFSSIAADGLPDGWATDYYWQIPDITAFSVADGLEGTAGRIINREPNDARFSQTLSVLPDTLYCFQGWIKADASGGRGANLSIEGINAYSDSVYQPQDGWRQVSLYGRTGVEQTSITVYARLGGYSGEAIGEAMFDNLSFHAVASVPAGYTVSEWTAPPTLEQDSAAASPAPAWPWLLLIALLYGMLAVFLACRVEAIEEVEETLPERHHLPQTLLAMLVLAAITRFVVMLVIPGYGVDVGCFTAWANRMADVGPASFYLTDQHSDYPPGYMLALWPIGLLGRLMGTGATPWMVKLPSVIADLACVYVLYRYATRHIKYKSAVLLAAIYAFCPLTYATGAAWGQVDAIPALLMLLVVLYAMDGRWIAALPLYTLAVLTKPQALMFGPMGLAAAICEFIWHDDKKTLKSFLWGLGISLALAAVVAVPFMTRMEQPIQWLVSLYAGTMTFYSHATVNAANLFFLFGKNWVSTGEPAAFLLRLTGSLTVAIPVIIHLLKRKTAWKSGLTVSQPDAVPTLLALSCLALPIICAIVPMSMSLMGTLLMVSVFFITIVQYWFGRQISNLPLSGAIMLIAFCSLGVMMHERYAFMAVALLVMAYAHRRDRRIFFLMLLTSISLFLNVGIVLDRAIRIGGSAGHLTAPAFNITSESSVLEYLLSAVNVLLAGYALHIGFALVMMGEPPVSLTPIYPASAQSRAEDNQNAAKRWLLQPYQAPSADKKDAMIIVLICAIYAAIALTNLGSMKAPQTTWTAVDENDVVVLELDEPMDFNILLYAGINTRERNFTVETSMDGDTWTSSPARINMGDCFAWKYQNKSFMTDAGETKYHADRIVHTGKLIRIVPDAEGLSIMELQIRNTETGAVMPVHLLSGQGEALIDEQSTMAGEPDWFNSTYFDEIYHARTAYEHMNAMRGTEPNATYEISHPPLGKVLMSFSVMIFGMTPFGWRFAGAIAGVLMLPGMYLLGRLITKRRIGAITAALLMAFDCMHFTQTRIATIDSFVTLFIIWAYYFMFRYALMDYYRTSFVKTLRPLASSGLFFGLSIASKWTGFYAGAGLAVIFFWVLSRRIRQGLAAQKAEGALADRDVVLTAAQEWPFRTIMTLLSCVVFFIVIPSVIYYVSFIPWFMRTEGGISIKKVLDASFTMYRYHAKPGFGMDHPYYSPWYEWPLSIKPMWYFAGGTVDGTASTIFSFGNLVVWWGGLAAVFATIYTLLRSHISSPPRQIIRHPEKTDTRPALLIISFLAQYLPWVPVPRGTYIYHYFTSLPFIIQCISLMLDYLADRSEKKARYASIAIMGLAFAFFIAFFPYISGLRVSTAWLDAMKWFPSWLYY